MFEKYINIYHIIQYTQKCLNLVFYNIILQNYYKVFIIHSGIKNSDMIPLLSLYNTYYTTDTYIHTTFFPCVMSLHKNIFWLRTIRA